MEETCEDCMRWEEELYWTHFQTLHFSQLLLPGFHNRLIIPQKFATYCKKKLPKTVTLKSPSGVTYNVGLEEDDEKTLSFCFGWDKFVKDHSLMENDLLIFKFHGGSEFEVLIFDGQTLCEKPTSYFIKKCGHAKKTKESGHLPVISPTSIGPMSEGRYPISVSKKMRGERSINNLDCKAAESRKSINETLKRKALMQAKRAISPKGFLVVMKRSHVLSKCFLNIPMRWCERNTSLKPQEVVMQVDERKWNLKMNFFGTKGRGGISTGWKQFVKENNLYLGDVLVFEPANAETKPLHLDVYVFRATDGESSNASKPANSSSSPGLDEDDKTIREEPSNDWSKDQIKVVYDSPIMSE